MLLEWPQLAILQNDRQLYGVERLFDSQQFENFELAVSANTGPPAISQSTMHIQSFGICS
jgi:hypothetical protein